MELPINEEDNAKKMLIENRYQLPNSKGKEDIWLIQYLRACDDADYENIYVIWKKIATTRYVDMAEEEMRALFLNFWEKAKKRRKSYRIFEYQILREEIEIINKSRIPLWHKEYALLVLAYYKILGRDRCSIGDIPSSLLFKFISSANPRSRDKIKLRQSLQEAGLFSVDKNFDVSLSFQRREGVSLGTFYQIKDVLSLFELLTGKIVCSKCGAMFEHTSKTKREICKECWRRKEAERSAKNRKYKEMAKSLLNGKER